MLLRALFALIFITAGVLHFVKRDLFLRMMPDWLPAHRLLVDLSGVIEVALGVLLLIPASSQLAAWGLIALLVAVFPANVNMALHPERWKKLNPIGLYARLPVQGLLIYWAWTYTAA